MWRTYVHMCTKYEGSMSNPVPGGGVQMMMPTTTMHDGQSVIV